MNKLNIIATFAESFRKIFAKGNLLTKSLFLPVLIAIGISLLTFFLHDSIFVHILYVFRMFFYALIAIMVHRIILEKHLNIGVFDFLKPDKSSIIYFLYMSFIYLLTTLMILFIALFIIPLTIETNITINKYTEYIIVLLIFFFPLLLMTRLSLIFPAISIGFKNELSFMLFISKNNSYRLFMVVGLIPLLFSITLTNIQNLEESVYRELILSIGSVIFLVIEASLLSISFKNLIELTVGDM